MFSDAQLLATAKASPEAVARHDKSAWLALFSGDAEVHDPVGSRGHAGAAALERFYETFIAPNEITFLPENDLVCGQTVVRDLVIRTRMGGTALQVDVPLFIRYEIVDEGGKPKVRRLFAHWELLPMMTTQVFKSGVASGIVALIKLSGNMMKHQGLSGALGFSRAFVGAGAASKRVALEWLEALAAGDDIKVSAIKPKTCALEFAGARITLAELAKQCEGLRWEKMLSGGRYVTVRLHLTTGIAVGQFEFEDDLTTLRSVRFFCQRP